MASQASVKLDGGYWPTFSESLDSLPDVKTFLAGLRRPDSYEGFKTISLTTPKTVASRILAKAVGAVVRATDVSRKLDTYTLHANDNKEAFGRYVAILRDRNITSQEIVEATVENGWNPGVCDVLNDDLRRKRDLFATRMIRVVVEEILSPFLQNKIGVRMCELLADEDDEGESLRAIMHRRAASEREAAADKEKEYWNFKDWLECYDEVVDKLTVGDLNAISNGKKAFNSKVKYGPLDRIKEESTKFVQGWGGLLKAAKNVLPLQRMTDEEEEELRDRQNWIQLKQECAAKLQDLEARESRLSRGTARRSPYVQALEEVFNKYKQHLEEIRDRVEPNITRDDRERTINARHRKTRDWYGANISMGLTLGQEGISEAVVDVLQSVGMFDERGAVANDYQKILRDRGNRERIAEALATQRRTRSSQQSNKRRSKGNSRGAKAKTWNRSSGKRGAGNGSQSMSDQSITVKKKSRWSKGKPYGGKKTATEKRVCYNCNKPGHMKRECPELKAGSK